jgi:hypothetical protein
MFPVYGGKCLSRKAVHNWVTNVSLMTKRLKRRCGSGWDNSQKASVLRFWSTDRATWQVYQCWGRICREINVFSGSNITYFIFYIPICGLFTDYPSYISIIRMVVAWYFDVLPVKLLYFFVSAVVSELYTIGPPRVSRKVVTAVSSLLRFVCVRRTAIDFLIFYF